MTDSTHYDAVCRACTWSGHEIAINVVRCPQESPRSEYRSLNRCWVSSVPAGYGVDRGGRAEVPGIWDEIFYLPAPYP